MVGEAGEAKRRKRDRGPSNRREQVPRQGTGREGVLPITHSTRQTVEGNLCYAGLRRYELFVVLLTQVQLLSELGERFAAGKRGCSSSSSSTEWRGVEDAVYPRGKKPCHECITCPTHPQGWSCRRSLGGKVRFRFFVRVTEAAAHPSGG
jgi:hypothetical protein